MMANSFTIYKNVKEMLLRSIGRRHVMFNHILTRQKNHSTFSSEGKKKFTIRNVFKDNPGAKYWLLGALAVTSGVTYYVYNNQNKKKLVINSLPPSPSHHCFPRGNDVNKLTVLLENDRKYPKQIQISGPSGCGKTQLARLLAENVSQSRRESYGFKLWPKDEVTATLLAYSKDSLLLSLKQLAAKLGHSEDEIKLGKTGVESQLDIVSQAVKEKLKQKSQWVLVVDDHNISEQQLTKWLPDSDWGNGYVIHTVLSEDIGGAEKQSKITNYNLNQMNPDSARQLFLGVINEQMSEGDNLPGDPPEHLLKLLHYNPLSLVYASVYFNHRVEQNGQYSYKDLYCDLDKTVKQLNEENPDTSGLLNIQSSSVALAAKVICDSSPGLVHVFDLLGSCKPCHPIPFGILSCHLKIPEYHVELKPEKDLSSESYASNEEAASSVTVTSELENEQSLWSVHGIVSRVVKISERIKLEVNALKSLFGYGDALSEAQTKPLSDGLEFVRSCPLLIRASEQMADVEVLSCHPIVHNVLRQVFVDVTIPLLEHNYLLIAERKHQQKSYFGRLQRFDPQMAIAEYHRSLGDNLPSQALENGFPLVTGTPHICSILGHSSTKDEDDTVKLREKAIVGHLQEHFNRVVSSFYSYYRMQSSDSSGMVATVLLLPHLESFLGDTWLTAANKGQIYRTMARIYCDVFHDYATCDDLLNKAYTVYKERCGETSLEIAGVLTQQAQLYSISEDFQQSKALLERALSIYQMDRKTSQMYKQPFEYGKALVALGVTCGSIGETVRSKDLLEKGLMELQNATPGDPHAKENKWFAAEISSAVTNLGHAYLLLGKINQGRKLLELALIGHQNVHGDLHAEVIRTLTTLSIAHAMQGNSQESKRLRNEAAKIKKKQDMKPLLLFS